MSKQNTMITYAECLSIELWISVFSYLEVHDLFYAFTHLNHYFNQILASKHLSFYIQLKENVNNYLQNTNITYWPDSILNRIICLHVPFESQSHYCFDFLQRYAYTFHRLQSLIIELNIPQLEIISQIFQHLHSLKYLSLVNDITPILFENILAIPTLHVCQLKFTGNIMKISDYQSVKNSIIETFYITVSNDDDYTLTNLFLSHMPKLKQLEIYHIGWIPQDEELMFFDSQHILPELRTIKYHVRTGYPTLTFFENLLQIAPVLKNFHFISNCAYMDEELFNNLHYHWWAIFEKLKHINIHIVGTLYMIDEINDEQRTKLNNNRKMLLSKNVQYDKHYKIVWTEVDKDILFFVHISIHK